MDHGLADVDVVRIEVVANIAINAGPRFEGLELRFGLRHVRVEIIEVAERLCFEAGVGVSGVVAFVVFDINEYAMFGSGGEELEVM